MCKRNGGPLELAPLTGLLELAIACRVDFGLASSEHIVRRHIWMVRTAVAVKGRRPVLEELFLPAVEHRWLQPQFLAQIRYRHFIQQVPSQDGDLLF
jgi:hypothetical protein